MKEFSTCFGNKKSPIVFMTDDSTAEKNALKNVHPSSIQLLCHFHVAQAEWRWIHCCKNIDMELKPVLMKMFQAVMYAVEESKLQSAYNEMKNAIAAHPEYLRRFEAFFQRRKEWTSVDRQKYLIRGHNTNNFAEASIRILKDVVLYRTKAFNSVALVDFVVSEWDNYLLMKLLDFANGRRTTLYTKSAEDINIPFQECIRVDNSTYTVPSATKIDTFYEVNTEIGHCTCVSGRTGAFCKHQLYLHHKLNVPIPTVPILDANERQYLAFLALGEKCPPVEFYKKMDTIADNNNVNSSDIFAVNMENSILQPEHQEMPTVVPASIEEKDELLQQFAILLKGDISKLTVCKLTNAIKNTDKSKAGLALPKMAYALQATKRTKRSKIKVQPTSIARRRYGVSRTSNRIQQGRPIREKRKHSL